MRGYRTILAVMTAAAMAIGSAVVLAGDAPDGKAAEQPKTDAAAAKPTKSDAPATKKDAKAAADAKKAEKLFDEGRDALFRGKYAEAVKLLKQAAAADKTKTRHRLYLARAHRYAGQAADAEKLLAAIVKASPDHVEAGQMLAELLAAHQKWDEVVQVLERLLKYRHDYPTYHMLAEAKYNLDDHEKARKYFEEAIKLNPASASDHYQLGNIYLAGNFFALAAGSYQRALALGYRSPVLHYKLGSAYFNLRNYFGRVAEVTVKSGKVGTINGAWYLIEPVPGRKDLFRAAPRSSAIHQVAKALETGLKEDRDIRFLRTNIYLNARRYKQAYAMFKKIAAEASDPTTPKGDRALFRYYFAQAAFGVGKYDEYLKLLTEAIGLDPQAYKATLVDAYLRVAEQHNQNGDLDGYIKYLRMAVEDAPRKAPPHLKLGSAYEEARRYAEAVVQWRMVLDLEPDHPKRMALLDLIRKYADTPQPAPPKKNPAARKAG